MGERFARAKRLSGYARGVATDPRRRLACVPDGCWLTMPGAAREPALLG